MAQGVSSEPVGWWLKFKASRLHGFKGSKVSRLSGTLSVWYSSPMFKRQHILSPPSRALPFCYRETSLFAFYYRLYRRKILLLLVSLIFVNTMASSPGSPRGSQHRRSSSHRSTLTSQRTEVKINVYDLLPVKIICPPFSQLIFVSNNKR